MIPNRFARFYVTSIKNGDLTRQRLAKNNYSLMVSDVLNIKQLLLHNF